MSFEQELPTAVNAAVIEGAPHLQHRETDIARDDEATFQDNGVVSGTRKDEENQEVDSNQAQMECWGKYGKTFIWIGMAIMWTAYEMDHTVLYNYQNYAASDFGQISSLGALQTAGTIIIAVMKPPIAKISDVAGRVETYIGIVIIYIISYVLCASAPNFEQYAVGYVIYSIGATGMQILNQIIVADITTSRWRGLANGLINLPFMIVPWLSAFIVDSALKTIGWRWGIGMFAIIMPVVSLGIIVPLFYFRHRSRKAGIRIRRPTKAKDFFMAIDLVGVTFLVGGCAMFLLPISLAGNTPGGWRNPWVPTVMVVGIMLLTTFVFYETKYATNPVLPARYFKSASLVLACVIAILDAFAFQVTHTYMYAWSTVSHNFSARDATFLTYTSGCFQVLAGLVTGYFMYRTRRYKWLLIIGAIIRLIGYGLMLRLRGSTNPTWELFFVQGVQGIGSGCVGTVVLVIAQIVVSRAELAQATALILLSIFMGQAIGSAVAGAIYTNLFKDRLRVHLGSGASESTINTVFQSITGNLPTWGSRERSAINTGYTDILKYMTISALVASAVPMLIVWLLPNLQLNDKHNLSDEDQTESKKGNSSEKPRASNSDETNNQPARLKSTLQSPWQKLKYFSMQLKNKKNRSNAECSDAEAQGQEQRQGQGRETGQQKPEFKPEGYQQETLSPASSTSEVTISGASPYDDTTYVKSEPGSEPRTHKLDKEKQ